MSFTNHGRVLQRIIRLVSLYICKNSKCLGYYVISRKHWTSTKYLIEWKKYEFVDQQPANKMDIILMLVWMKKWNRANIYHRSIESSVKLTCIWFYLQSNNSSYLQRKDTLYYKNKLLDQLLLNQQFIQNERTILEKMVNA